MQTKFLLLAATLLATPVFAQTPAPAPIRGVKNIIIVVNDGAGQTVYDATRLYLGRPLTTDSALFQKTYVSTFPLRPDGQADNSADNNTPTDPLGDAQDPRAVYDSAKYWDTTPVPGISLIPGYIGGPGTNAGFLPVPGPLYPAGFQGYEFSRFAHPDSGNTASSIANGKKSYNNSINVDGTGDPQVTVIDILDAAKKSGKVSGVVATVQFGDATPAALGGAHNIFRANRQAIADELFSTGRLTVIGGTGNPDFNDDGLARAPNYSWITPQLWNDLKTNQNLSGKNPFKFTLIQDKEGIDALAAKTTKSPARLAMIMKGDNSTQFNRTDIQPGTINATQDTVYRTPLKTTVPTQVNLTLAALNRLDRNGRGFYLMTEAGAVDRAEHANNTARMIEEQIDSENTVQAIIDWVNRKDTAATWDNTLLIITADHDHLLYGPQGDTIPYQGLVDAGAGNIPGNKWFGPNHGTGLVPLFAYGRGSQQVIDLATRTDAYTDAQGRTFGYGRYLDQTDLGNLLKATVGQ